MKIWPNPKTCQHPTPNQRQDNATKSSNRAITDLPKPYRPWTQTRTAKPENPKICSRKCRNKGDSKIWSASGREPSPRRPLGICYLPIRGLIIYYRKKHGIMLEYVILHGVEEGRGLARKPNDWNSVTKSLNCFLLLHHAVLYIKRGRGFVA